MEVLQLAEILDTAAKASKKREEQSLMRGEPKTVAKYRMEQKEVIEKEKKKRIFDIEQKEIAHKHDSLLSGEIWEHDEIEEEDEWTQISQGKKIPEYEIHPRQRVSAQEMYGGFEGLVPGSDAYCKYLVATIKIPGEPYEALSVDIENDVLKILGSKYALRTTLPRKVEAEKTTGKYNKESETLTLVMFCGTPDETCCSNRFTYYPYIDDKPYISTNSPFAVEYISQSDGSACGGTVTITTPSSCSEVTKSLYSLAADDVESSTTKKIYQCEEGTHQFTIGCDAVVDTFDISVSLNSDEFKWFSSAYYIDSDGNIGEKLPVPMTLYDYAENKDDIGDDSVTRS
ncbi:Dynein axonemal assembly factor 6 like protein, partial [Aduncisulcus paluster]